MDLITDKKKYLLLKCGKLCPKTFKNGADFGKQQRMFIN